jgi:DNA mismatch repair protein MutS
MLKGTGHGPLPPLLEQYVRLRDAYPDYLLFFQVGEFYETFGEDAERFSRALGLTLTHKTSKDFSTPMAGVPMRAVDAHIERLLALGFRVAVADQVEDPATAQGLVDREVVQLITPGTIQSEALLRGEDNWLAGVASGDGYGLALLDVSTGEFRCCQVSSRGALYDELARYRPSEVLLAPELSGNQAFSSEFGQRFRSMRSSASFEPQDCLQMLEKQFGGLPAGLEPEAILRACGAVLGYAAQVNPEQQHLSGGKGTLAAVRRLLRYDPGSHMRLDETAIRALEVFETISPTAPENATLFAALNETRTAPGRRCLKAWLRAPLLDAARITERLEAVEALYRDAPTRHKIRSSLYRAHDLERLAARVANARANARDLNALGRTLEIVPEVRDCIANLEPRLLRDLAARLDAVPEAGDLVRAALQESLPLRLTDGGLVRDGFDADLDAHRAKALEGRTWIAQLEETERARTGISGLKVGYNNVFGYFLEVTNPHLARVPEDYKQIATLKDRSRYTRPDLREREREVLHFEDRASKREYTVFLELRENLAIYTERLQLLAAALAELDVIASLAEIAAERGYVRPEILEDGVLEIEQARHPVVELALKNPLESQGDGEGQKAKGEGKSSSLRFVPNDIRIADSNRITLITGPNMSGKSTYLRQTALIALMAQIGSFVPAKRARTRVFDRIYTRVGSSDDLAGGASTFMVEMRELATILHGATERSLVILDEVGRGTSTFDGLAIAQAACEFLHQTRAVTLYATHYFELTTLEGKLSGVANLHVAAQEEAVGGLRFYHQVMPGPASKSYGVQVARLAGLPPEAVSRAEALLAGFEANSADKASNVAKALLALDLSRLTPLQALQKLEELQSDLRV